MARTLPAGMADHLASKATTLAWCWRLEANDGTVLGFTDHDADLTVSGTTYRAATGFTASAATLELGLAVGSLSAEGALQSAALTDLDLSAGKWDNAAITLTLVNWSNTAQHLVMKTGNLGEVTRGDNGFAAEVRGIAHQWQQPKGRVFGRTCDATLGDARCTVDLASPVYRGTGTVTAAAGEVVTATGLGSFQDGWFARGLLTFTGGAATGMAYDVAAFATGSSASVVLEDAPLYAIGPGDTFTVTAGCDKRFATCRDTFMNAANFRGFPHMPGDEFAVQYPSTPGNNAGTSQRYETF